MSYLLIEVEKGIIHETLEQVEADFLSEHLEHSSEEDALYYLDAPTLSALEKDTRALFEENLQMISGDWLKTLSDAELRKAISAHFAVIPEDMLSPTSLENFTAIFGDHLGGPLLADCTRALACLLDAETLRTLSMPARLNALDAASEALPKGPHSKPLFHFETLSEWWSSSIQTPLDTSPSIMEPDELEGPLAQVLKAFCHAIIRGVCLSTPENELLPIIQNDPKRYYPSIVSYLAHSEMLEDRVPRRPMKHLITTLRRVLGRNSEGSTILITSQEMTRHLVVTVKAGHDMAIRDIRTSDPYCVLEALDFGDQSSQRGRTEVCQNTLEPRWDETFHFILSKDGSVKIRVMDADYFSSDDPMGTLHLKLDWLTAGETVHKTFDLDHVEKGKLELSLCLNGLQRAKH